MKKLEKIIGLPLIFVGLLFVFLPYHVEFTGYVLLLLGAGVIVCGLLKDAGKKKLLRWLIAAMAVCLTVLLAASGYIAWYGSSDEPKPDSEYAVVLGAQVVNGVPSKVLQERLDMGVQFMKENPELLVIVSGGMGTEQNPPEAQVMYDYMVNKGADGSRIYMEDKSTDTRENLIFSSQMAEELGLDKTKLTIISSEFHLCRARYIAKSLGLDAGHRASETKTGFLLSNYYIRESFSFVKAFYEAQKGRP